MFVFEPILKVMFFPIVTVACYIYYLLLFIGGKVRGITCSKDRLVEKNKIILIMKRIEET